MSRWRKAHGTTRSRRCGKPASRFNSGVTDNIEVCVAQDALATANDAYIASLYSYILAKIYGTGDGVAESRFADYLKGDLKGE